MGVCRRTHLTNLLDSCILLSDRVQQKKEETQLNTVQMSRKVFAITMLVLIVAVAMSTVVFADSISDKVNGGLKEVYSTITAITVPAGAVSLAVSGLFWIFGDAKSAQSGKSWFIRIVIGIAVVYLAPFLIDQISKWFSDGSASIW